MKRDPVAQEELAPAQDQGREPKGDDYHSGVTETLAIIRMESRIA